MRLNLALAFLVSVLLIGGASWSRFYNHQESEAELIAIETRRQADTEHFNNVVLPVLENSATSSMATPEPLTATDLVGRQLLVDYVQMASAGQASEDEILKLAERYVESIPSLNSAPIISYSELSIGGSDRASLQRYADAFTVIYKKYASDLKNLERSAVLDSGSISSYASFAEEAAPIYKSTAQKLKTLKVPGVLAQNHLGLVNVYLATGSGFEAIAQAERDSASAFAGLLAVSDSSNEGERLLAEIERILNSHGI